jgi:hypothetical protein
MMTHPREYDIAKTAALDFAPTCDLSVCDRPAAQGIQCTSCRDVRSLFCAAHAQGLAYAVGVAECGACGAKAVHHSALYDLVPLGAFLIGGAR